MLFRAGPLTVCFEPELAFLRYARLGDRDILRGVYAAVRDECWGTVPTEVSGLTVENRGGSFSVTFDVACRAGPIDFTWRGWLEGYESGTVRYTMDGGAHSDFLARRIGFCVLHPVRECAGTPCTIEKTSGAVERTTFPSLVAPHQPFHDITALSHEAVQGVTAEVRCQGDIFETEDQRNWGDGSFKTYPRPLAMPSPYEVHSGERVHQSVTLSLHGRVPAVAEALQGSGQPVSFLVDATRTRSLPKIGLQLSAAPAPSPGQVALLRALRLDHLRVDLAPQQPSWETLLATATSSAAALSTGLEVAVNLGPDPASDLAALLAAASELQSPVRRWMLFEGGRTPAPEVLRPARCALQRHSPAASLYTGSDIYFAELNRDRPGIEDLDGFCYPLSPQVHAFDNATMAEALQAMAAQLGTARSFAGGLPIAVTPITLRPRPGKGGGGPPPVSGLPPGADPRQATLFAAGWTVGSYKHLAAGGADSVTYYETTGARGVMMDGECVFPIYHVLAAISEWNGTAVLETSSSDPLSVEGLALGRSGSCCVLLANLTLSQQAVALHGLGARVWVRRLGRTAVDDALSHPDFFRTGRADLVEAVDDALVLTLAPHEIIYALQT